MPPILPFALAAGLDPQEASRILCVVFLLVGLFHLHLHLRRRSVHDYLWFGLVALFMALREWPATDWIPGFLLAGHLPLRVAWIALFASGAAFIQFLWPFLGRPVSRWLRIYQGVRVAAILLVAGVSEGLLRRYVHLGFLLEVPLLLAFPVVILRQVMAGHPEARTIGIGALVLTFGCAHEVGYWLGFWPNLNGVTWGFALFVVSMALSLSNRVARIHAEADALNLDLERKVAERTQALEEAQERLHRLGESAGGALQDPRAWVEATVRELAPELGVARLEAWRILASGSLETLAGRSGEPPALELLRRLEGEAELQETERSALIPVRGAGGGLRAVLVAVGKKGPWSDVQRRLVLTMARHLAGALDLQDLHHELARARVRREATREELIARGDGALQVCELCGRCYDHEATLCPADGQILGPVRAFPFRLHGRYRLTRLLGEGGMGLVFEAEDERLARRVAVKTLKPDHFHSEERRQRFETEARALAQIHHPGVISIFDSGELEDGTMYLITERLLGASLGRVLQAFGPGRPDQVAQLLRQTGSALEATHARGILHRDLKPDNIFVLVTPKGLRFKLLDFGLAKEMEVDSSITRTGFILGTPLYMSPEQLRGHPLDGRSDLYALAAITFEALSGQRMVRKEALGDICVEVLHQPARQLREVLPGLPADIDTALGQGLAKSPEARPATVVAWTEPLADRLQDLPTTQRGWPDDLAGLPEATLGSGGIQFGQSATLSLDLPPLEP
ncbi:MAG TPA: protein kinase [Holophagaceae bacterium]|nr:protein kinase [Holophagaceae bacterium]